MPEYMDVPEIKLNYGGRAIPAVGLGTRRSWTHEA